MSEVKLAGQISLRLDAEQLNRREAVKELLKQKNLPSSDTDIYVWGLEKGEVMKAEALFEKLKK